MVKKHKDLFEKVVSFDNLYASFLKAKRGKSDRKEVLEFNYNLESELLKLRSELLDGSFRTGKYRVFTIFEPKERKIFALPFRDRVVHHAIYSVLYPIYDGIFISDSFACRKNKGTHKGADRLQSFLKRVDDDYYVLKCDVSKYFPSVDKGVLKRVIRKKISDKKLLFVIDEIIDSPKEGIPIGNLTSQLFANIYLNELDCYIKKGLGFKHYIRYMDDFVLLHKSKKVLHLIKEKIREFLVSLKLKLHPKKAVVFPVKCGVDFLGYKIFKFFRLARKSTVFRFIYNTKKKIKHYFVGYISFDKLLETFNSWVAYLSHANTYNLRRSIRVRWFKNVY